MTEFVKPTIEYFELWPLLVVFGVACLGVVVEAFLPRTLRYPVQVVLAIGGLVLALVGVVLVAQDVQTYEDGAARLVRVLHHSDDYHGHEQGSPSLRPASNGRTL